MHLHWPWSKRTCLGIDLQTSRLNLLEIQPKKNEHYVQNVASLPLIISAEKSLAASISNAIEATFAQTRRKASVAIIGLAASQVITKTIYLNKQWDKQTIADYIEVNVDRYLPYARDELCFDFQIQNSTEQQAAQQKILLVACRQSSLEDYLCLFANAPLQPTVVDTVPYALMRALNYLFPSSQTQACLALLDINYPLVNMLILEEGNLIYNQEERCNFKAEDPEFAVRTAQLIKGLLHYFLTTHAHKTLDKLLLSGHGACLQDMAKLVSLHTGYTTECVNPFNKLRLAPQLDTDLLQQQAPAYMLSYGLALRGLDVNHH